MNLFAWLLLMGCVFSCGAAAQEAERGPDVTGTTNIPGVQVLTIPGKPFSAHSSTDWTRTLEDGMTVTMHLDAKLVRDGAGRVYREHHHFVPASSHYPAPLYEIRIYDPVAKVSILCDGRNYRCTVTDYKPQTYFTMPAQGTTPDGTHTMTRENLGSDNIDGIRVVGTRETTTTSAGVVGNDRPLVSTREFWYSDELQTNLAVTRLDPRTGKVVVRLSEVSREEPDAHIFQIPIGFSVVDLRSPARVQR